MKNTMNKPCCYFYYDDNGRLAYVGKANGTLKQRIAAHAKEKKFQDCHCEFDIRYQVFDTAADMDAAETVYIKSLSPYLNTMDMTVGFFPTVNLDKDELRQYGYDEPEEDELEEDEPGKKYWDEYWDDPKYWTPEGKIQAKILRHIDGLAQEFEYSTKLMWGWAKFESFNHTSEWFKECHVLGRIVCLLSANGFIDLSIDNREMEKKRSKRPELFQDEVKMQNYRNIDTAVSLLHHLKSYVKSFPTQEIKALEENTDWVVQQFEEFRKGSNDD